MLSLLPHRFLKLRRLSPPASLIFSTPVPLPAGLQPEAEAARRASSCRAFRWALAALCCLICLPFCGGAALANDSIARIGTGGIELLRSNDIRMLEETLTISPQRVHVAYRFRNDSPRDIRTTVAFPTPEYWANSQVLAEDMHVGPVQDFVLTVDGAPQAYARERRAFFRGKEVTTALRKAGLSDTEIFETFGIQTDDKAPNFLESTLKPEVTRKMWAVFPPLKKRWPPWSVRETLYWDQTFPAGQEVTVTHSYKAMSGALSNIIPTEELAQCLPALPVPSLLEGVAPPNEACATAAVCEALQKTHAQRRDAGETGPRTQIIVWSVEYILGTGNHWKGPIGAFTLRLIKEQPEDAVALCFPGTSVQVDPLTVEYRHTDFRPQDRLRVHFYQLGYIGI